MTLRHLFLLLAFLVPSVPSQAIEIDDDLGELVDQFQATSPDTAKQYLADYTVLVKLGQVDSSIGELMPISSVAVLYFAGNGTVLGWSSKSERVEKGRWIVDARSGQNEVCLIFPEGQGKGVCTILSRNDRRITESTRGNPFNLKAEQPAPFELGNSGVSLREIATQLGL